MMDTTYSKRRHILRPVFYMAIVFLISLFVLLSCGKKSEQKANETTEAEPQSQAQQPEQPQQQQEQQQQQLSQESSPYADWERYTYGHFVGYFSPQSPFIDRKGQVVTAFDKFLAEICDILELPEPKEKIYLFVYATPMEAESITGRSTPFMDDSAIHWAVASAYGYQLTKFVLAKNEIKPGRYDVVYEGIANLLDFSGINYHAATAKLIDSGRFVSAVDLGDNRIFDTLSNYVKRAESASFVGFIMYEYGTDKVYALNKSQEFWVETVEAVFRTPINIFGKRWMNFARAHSVDTGAVVDDSATP
jgi:hypothetical protein